MPFRLARSFVGISFRLAVLLATPALSLASALLTTDAAPSPEVAHAQAEFNPVTDLDLY